MQKLKIIIPVLIVLGLAGYWFYSRSTAEKEEAALNLSGNVELTEVRIAFKMPGKLSELAVREGDPVKKGDVIARLDQSELMERRNSALAAYNASRSLLAQVEKSLEYRKQQVATGIERAEADLQAAQSRLNLLESGSRPQEIAEAQAALDRAQADFARASKDWERAQDLRKTEDISAAQADDFRARFESAKALLDQAKQRLSVVKEGPRRQEIEAARAQAQAAKAGVAAAKAARLDIDRMGKELDTRRAEIENARAQLGVIEQQIEDSVAISPVDGIVLSKAAEPGEVLATGATVVTIGDLSNPWVRAYLPEQYLGRVKLGTTAQVTADSLEGRTLDGRISFISSEAEFTPKQIQTPQERVKLVYRIKVDVPNPSGALKSNMPADVRIPL